MAELTILGLLSERPSHGYDLEQVIEQRGIRRWADIGFSSIYYLLAKLEKRGLVRSAAPAAGPKSRRVFALTPEGRSVAERESSAWLADPQPVAQPFLVALSNLKLLSEDQYVSALRERLARLDEQIADVRRAQPKPGMLPVAAREVFSYSLSLMEAERSWLAERVRVADE